MTNDGGHLSAYLAAKKNKGKYVRVVFDVVVDTSTANRRFYVYTPRPIARVEYNGTYYELNLRDGNNMNPTIARNNLEIYQKKPTDRPKYEPIAITMQLDGTDFATADEVGGQAYIIAFNGSGETVYGEGEEDSGGYRAELHWGRPPDNRADYPDTDKWISSAVKNLSVTMLPRNSLKVAEKSKRGNFSDV